MKRSGLGLIGPALLLVLLPMTLSSCATACGCTAPAAAGTPPPVSATPAAAGTPPPVSAAQAASSASKIAGVTGMTAELGGVLNWRQFYRSSSGNAVAFVDAVDGTVFEVVLTDQMPDTATADAGGAAAEATARSAAEAFIAQAGLSTNGLTESATLKTVAEVSAYDVTWKDGSGPTATKYQVSVNATTGAVFAYLDLRLARGLAAPIAGKSRATTLAIAALGKPGQQALAANFSVDFSSGTQVSTWDVSLGVPSATESNVFEAGGLVRVDAATGAASIVKS
jgi:hypothetical protein